MTRKVIDVRKNENKQRYNEKTEAGNFQMSQIQFSNSKTLLTALM